MSSCFLCCQPFLDHDQSNSNAPEPDLILRLLELNSDQADLRDSLFRVNYCANCVSALDRTKANFISLEQIQAQIRLDKLDMLRLIRGLWNINKEITNDIIVGPDSDDVGEEQELRVKLLGLLESEQDYDDNGEGDPGHGMVDVYEGRGDQKVEDGDGIPEELTFEVTEPIEPGGGGELGENQEEEQPEEEECTFDEPIFNTTDGSDGNPELDLNPALLYAHRKSKSDCIAREVQKSNSPIYQVIREAKKAPSRGNQQRLKLLQTSADKLTQPNIYIKSVHVVQLSRSSEGDDDPLSQDVNPPESKSAFDYYEIQFHEEALAPLPELKPDVHVIVVKKEKAIRIPTFLNGKPSSREDKSRLMALYGRQQAHPEHFFCLNSSCNEEFESDEILKEHVQSHQGSHIHICSDCGADFNYLSRLHSHQRRMRHTTPVLTFQCQDCTMHFPTMIKLSRHTKKVHSDPMICTRCSKEFHHRSMYRKHMNSHLKLKLFVCELCGAKYTTANQLRNHCGRLHPESFNLPEFKCEHCDKLFTGKQSLVNHMRLFHLNEYKYQCEICGYRSMDRMTRASHMLVHTKVKAYECEICQGKFARKQYMKEHMRKHTGESYKCEVCGRGCSSKVRLRGHLRSHSGLEKKKRKHKIHRKVKKEQGELGEETLEIQEAISQVLNLTM